MGAVHGAQIFVVPGERGTFRKVLAGV